MTSAELTTAAARGSSHLEKADVPVSPAGPGTLPGTATGRESHREPSSTRFRADVAGLRAVAVGLVLLYHAGLPFLPGGFVGVDVFFVISGFLITGQLITEIERTGRVSLLGFYARRAKRILPAATVVLAASAVAVRLFVPRGEWQGIGGDIAAAAIYVVNWRFADRAVDYLAADTPPSPVQHFWSLAVEEQFYLVWPLLIILAILAARRLRRTNVRPVLWVGLAILAVPSFVWSIVATAASPQRAFFVSTTRLWELGIGAGIALIATRAARMPRALAVILGWLGLAAIVVAALLVTADTAWPGYAAALPTLGAAAVIAAGAAAGSRGPVLVLGTRPFRWVGDLSYSLYLWHWPMLIVAAAYWDDLSLTRGMAVALASVVPAWLTFRLVENPLRYSRAISKSPRLALSLGGNFTMAGICAGLALVLTGAWAAAATPSGGRYAPGAALLSTTPGTAPIGPVPERFDFISPDPLKLRQGFMDVPVTNRDKCFQQVAGAEVLWCTYGKPDGATTVALVGDSKMDQWLPAFQVLAEQNDWKLVIAAKGACAFTSAKVLKGDGSDKLYTDCIEWNRTLLRRLVEERPDYVVTSQSAATALDASGKGASVDAMVAGVRSSWKKLDSVGTKVIVLANNPHPGPAIVQCADKNRKHLSACAFDRERHDQDPAYRMQRKAVAGMPKVKMIDLFDAVCPTEKCPVVFGNVLIYRGGSHIGAAYVKTMAPHLARALSDIGVPARFSPSN
ncbi:acyltransferase family protein [Micromonospora sp. NPDC007271]|uniref:acyltransferase family protein n=1 Tax=Micromonospora sp. NPDC007271 TaxID=3154587 RepID=UPI003404F920